MSKKLLISNNSEEIPLYDSNYNYYVVDTTKTYDKFGVGVKTIVLQNMRSGDTTLWDGITDWGDGISDNLLTHTYEIDGIYHIKTKYVMVFSDMKTGQQLMDTSSVVKVIDIPCINKNMNNIAFVLATMYNIKDGKINLKYWELDNIEDIAYLFAYNHIIASIDNVRLNKGNKLKSCYGTFMFVNIKEVNLNDMYTDNVIDYNYMFYGCSFLQKLNISNFNINPSSTHDMLLDGVKNISEIRMDNCNATTVNIIITSLNSLVVPCTIYISEDVWNDNELNVELATSRGITLAQC